VYNFYTTNITKQMCKITTSCEKPVELPKPVVDLKKSLLLVVIETFI